MPERINSMHYHILHIVHYFCKKWVVSTDNLVYNIFDKCETFSATVPTVGSEYSFSEMLFVALLTQIKHEMQHTIMSKL